MSLASVTVEDLTAEISRHHDAPHIIEPLLQELRSRTIDLREFCSRVRQMLGPDVLVRTVKGLQDNQKRKRAATFNTSTSADAISVPLAAAAGSGTGSVALVAQAMPAGTGSAALKSLVPPCSAPAASDAWQAPQQDSMAAQEVLRTHSHASMEHVAPMPFVKVQAVISNSAPGSSDSPRSDGTNLGTKVLIHALLCPKVR